MWLTVRSGEASGTVVEVDGQRFLLGRGEECDLTLPDTKVSRRHALLEPVGDGGTRLQDLGSSNGTFVNGERVESAVLKGQEQVQLGSTVLATSTERPGGTAGATALGSVVGFLRADTASAIQRLVKRSTRRATYLAAAAVAIALGLAATVATILLTGRTTAATVQRAVARVAPATVLIESRLDGVRVETGSGFVLDAARGLVVTNAHVIARGNAFAVGATGRLRPARVVAAATCEDLALLRVSDTKGLKSLPLGSQSSLVLGQTVVAVGYPSNASERAELASTSGVVSVVRTAYNESALDIPRYPNVVETDAPINPGSSGGPLVDLNGKLVGVNSAGRTLAPDGRIVQGQSYAIGVDRVKQVVPTLASGHSIGWSGVSFGFRRTGRPGLVVGPVVPGTEADKVGLGSARGSLLTAVNRVPVDNSLVSYCDAIGSLRSGQAVLLTLLSPDGRTQRQVRLRLQ